jgi:hypothetical protein
MKLAAVAVVVCVLGAGPLCTYSEYPSVEKQMKLNEGMTMEQVRALLGDPDRTASKLCEEGQCRLWTYEGPTRKFDVWFRPDKAGWLLTRWN